jgi:hypothetical protein
MPLRLHCTKDSTILIAESWDWPYRVSEFPIHCRSVLYAFCRADAAVTILTLIPILIVVGLALVIVPFWFILKKAGFSPWLSLINIIPLGTLVLLYVVAFAEWSVIPAVPAGWPPQPPSPPQV